jgi:hypothetical protein
MILTKLPNEAELQHVWKYWRAYEDEYGKTRNSYVDGRCWNKCLLYEWTAIFVRIGGEGELF